MRCGGTVDARPSGPSLSTSVPLLHRRANSVSRLTNTRSLHIHSGDPYIIRTRTQLRSKGHMLCCSVRYRRGSLSQTQTGCRVSFDDSSCQSSRTCMPAWQRPTENAPHPNDCLITQLCEALREFPHPQRIPRLALDSRSFTRAAKSTLRRRVSSPFVKSTGRHLQAIGHGSP